MDQMLSNRFDVFSGIDYYPRGGGNDYQASFASVELAIDHIQNTLKPEPNWSWWQIWDSVDKKIIATSDQD